MIICAKWETITKKATPVEETGAVRGRYCNIGWGCGDDGGGSGRGVGDARCRGWWPQKCSGGKLD